MVQTRWQTKANNAKFQTEAAVSRTVEKNSSMPERLGERRSSRLANRDASGALGPTCTAETAITGDTQETEPKARHARCTGLESLLEDQDFSALLQPLHIRNVHSSQQDGTPTSNTKSRATLPEPTPTHEISTITVATSPANESLFIRVIRWLAEIQISRATSTTTSGPKNIKSSSPLKHLPPTTPNELVLTTPSPTTCSPVPTPGNLYTRRPAEASLGFKRRVLRICVRGACISLAYLYLGVWHLLIFLGQAVVWLQKPRSAAKTAVLHVALAAGMVLFVLCIMSMGAFCSIFFKMGLCDTVFARYGCKDFFRVDYCGIETEALNFLRKRFRKNGHALY